jgi:dethiobiotin synthetase/adenosylmethionine--8-amino-7-oxononanoate aminotransferase
MFAGCIHQPALELSQMLLRYHDNPRLAKVFFTDNGSTGVEVAVKMALRSARKKQGWEEDREINIIGLKGCYHGDTIGAMDCAEPSAYNEQESWYTGRGRKLSSKTVRISLTVPVWLDYPKIRMTQGKWVVSLPDNMEGLDNTKSSLQFSSLSEIFDRTRISHASYSNSTPENETYQAYASYVQKALHQHNNQSFGGLILEPVILGAGGMVFVLVLCATATQVSANST